MLLLFSVPFPSRNPAMDDSAKKRNIFYYLLVFGLLFLTWVVFSEQMDGFHLTLGVISCGFVTWLSADLVFDVRFLPNPHWEADLRPYCGKDQPIIDYLQKFDVVEQTINQINNLFQSWLPMLEANNRNYVTIAIGCTGGKHRSVYVAETLAAMLGNTYQVELDHKCLILQKT